MIGSDGVFSQLTKQHIVDIVKNSESPQEAANSLTWISTSNGERNTRASDNATAIVLRLKGWGGPVINYTKELEKRGLRTVRKVILV